MAIDDARPTEVVHDSSGVQLGAHNTQVNIYNTVTMDATSLPAARQQGVSQVVDNLPPASGIFVGRDLTILAELLNGGAAANSGVVIGQAAVHGLGGIGKSELVLHYARIYADRYTLEWWITADTPELAADLGDLPLALEQAAAYISQHVGLDFDGYQTLLRTRFARIAVDAAEGGVARRTIASVWQVTMQTIRSRSALADQVMTVLGWFAPEALPEEVLAPLAEDPGDLGDAFALLASYNMINRDSGVVGVHRLVQAVTRSDQHQAGMDDAVRLIAAAIPDDPINNTTGWPRWNDLLPHINTLLANLPDAHENPVVLQVGDRAAAYRGSQGQTTEAISLFERVLTDRRRILGDSHPDTLTTRNNLAGAYNRAGRVIDALHMLERVLDDRRRTLGDSHPDTLETRNSLALAYGTAGRTGDAVDLLERVLADRRRVLGGAHPEAIATCNSLAVAYVTAGRTGDAVDLLEQVLTDRCRVLGDTHPETLATRNDLIDAYERAGRTVDAVNLLEEALTQRRQALGNNHPDTLATRDRLFAARQRRAELGGGQAT